MRVISMQSPKVWNILNKDEIYEANLSMCREAVQYPDDMRNLGGAVPIWCCAYPDLGFHTIYDGSVLDSLRIEMHLNQCGCWDDFLMYEIEVPDCELHISTYNKENPYCKMFGCLRKNMVRAVYKIEDSETDGWYYKVIIPIWIMDENDCITNTALDCYFWTKYSCKAPEEYFHISKQGRCLFCKSPTQLMNKNKHLCSLGCMSRLQDKFMRSCVAHGFNPTAAVGWYNVLSDEDLAEGVYKFVKRNLGI